jgi:hypothetical protein
MVPVSIATQSRRDDELVSSSIARFLAFFRAFSPDFARSGAMDTEMVCA